ncbi:MAG: YHYH protein [Phycisphaerales bacterium]
MRHHDFLTSFVAISALASNALAHPPELDGHHADPGPVRLWTNATTGEVVCGSFLAAARVDGVVKVSIARESGGVAAIPLAGLIDADRAEALRRIDEIKAINERLAGAAGSEPVGAARAGEDERPSQAAPFDMFAPWVKTRWDDRWLFIESDGLPHAPSAPGAKSASEYSHPMMVGITAWQQQVPLPQAYTGENAWRIPLQPEIAEKPVSAKEELFRGAIAIAANGVPIFNPIKNDGRTDTFLAGELDEFGGHCGRADDYHYHIAPLTLQKVLGRDKPLAYALDGFPIYGYFDPAAKAGGPSDEKCCPLGGSEKLDELNGHYAAPSKDAPAGTKGLYHYHASAAYPYINGGLRGKVTVKDDQIDPQPRASPVREAGKPLRGAKITGFKVVGENSWSLEYTLGGKKHVWNYRIEGEGRDAKYIFEFVDPDGTKKTETFAAGSRRDRPPAGDNPPGDGRRRRRDGERGERGPRRGEAKDEKPAPGKPLATASDFTLTSSAVGADGKLPAEFTCDGASISPPLAWAKAPEGTKSFAVTMHHIPGPPRPGDKAGEDKHVYLVLYNIPAETLSLDKGDAKVGIRGINTVNRRAEYAPPCSKGPGDKKYTLTVYALSKEPTITPADKRGATMDELLAAIKETTLGTATLDVTYARVEK